MDVTVLRDQLDPEWDDFLEGRIDGYYQQSSLWAKLKERTTGWRAVQVIIRDKGQIIGGAQLFIYRLPLYGAIGYIANGPVLASKDPAIQNFILDQLDHVARKEKIIFLKVQPPYGSEDIGQMLLERRAQVSQFAATIRGTIVIDLRPEPELLLAQMHSKRRNSIRRAEKRNVVIRSGIEADMPAFFQLRKEHARQRGYSIGSADYYNIQRSLFSAEDRYSLFLAEYEGELLAAAINIIFGKIASGLILVSNELHQELNAPALLNWRSILWAKEHGCIWYDFNGVKPDEAELLLNNQPLPDTHSGRRAAYKRSFGGQVILRPESYNICYFPPRLLTTRLVTSLTEARSIPKLVTNYLPR